MQGPCQCAARPLSPSGLLARAPSSALPPRALQSVHPPAAIRSKRASALRLRAFAAAAMRVVGKFCAPTRPVGGGLVLSLAWCPGATLLAFANSVGLTASGVPCWHRRLARASKPAPAFAAHVPIQTPAHCVAPLVAPPQLSPSRALGTFPHYSLPAPAMLSHRPAIPWPKEPPEPCMSFAASTRTRCCSIPRTNLACPRSDGRHAPACRCPPGSCTLESTGGSAPTPGASNGRARRRPLRAVFR